MCKSGNLYEVPPGSLDTERLESLLEGDHFTLERIYSTGQVTPEDQWYDQQQAEWVVLLSGAARLRFADPDQMCELEPGDYVYIAPHHRHRVEWTDPDRPTVWLALHHR